jgi:hypothetical protein
MIFCRGCGKSIHETALNCPSCGVIQNFILPRKLKKFNSDKESGLAYIAGLFLFYGLTIYIGLINLITAVGFIFPILLSMSYEEFKLLFTNHLIQASFTLSILLGLFLSTKGIDTQTTRVDEGNQYIKNINNFLDFLNINYNVFISKNIIKNFNKKPILKILGFLFLLYGIACFYNIIQNSSGSIGLLSLLNASFNEFFVLLTGVFLITLKPSNKTTLKTGSMNDHELTFLLFGEKFNLLILLMLIIFWLVFLQYESPYLFISTSKIILIFLMLSLFCISIGLILRWLNYKTIGNIGLAVGITYFFITTMHFCTTEYNFYRLDFFRVDYIQNFDIYRFYRKLDSDEIFIVKFIRQYVNVLLISSSIPFVRQLSIQNIKYGSIKGDYDKNIFGTKITICVASSFYIICVYHSLYIIINNFLPIYFL